MRYNYGNRIAKNLHATDLSRFAAPRAILAIQSATLASKCHRRSLSDRHDEMGTAALRRAGKRKKHSLDTRFGREAAGEKNAPKPRNDGGEKTRRFSLLIRKVSIWSHIVNLTGGKCGNSDLEPVS